MAGLEITFIKKEFIPFVQDDNAPPRTLGELIDEQVKVLMDKGEMVQELSLIFTEGEWAARLDAYQHKVMTAKSKR